MKAPNILWLFCEDVCPWMSLWGDDTVPTPHLQKLAADGTLFTNAFSVAPVCSPARSSLITGCMPTTLGVHQHQSARGEGNPIYLPPHVRTLPEIFRAAGYHTYNHGKDDYNFTYDRRRLYDGEYEMHRLYGASGGGDWSGRKPGQPFFGQITLWGGKNQKKPARGVDPARIRIDPYYPDTDEVRRLYQRHYDQIMVTDDEVGQVVQRLKDEGLYDNTIIFFFSDHGYALLRHKQFLYDGGIHIPLVIAAPGQPDRVSAGGVRSDLVSSIDIAATTLELAGLPTPDWMESRNVFAGDYGRDFVISARDRCDFTIDRIRCVRTDRYKYIRNFMTDRPLMQPQYRDRTPAFIEWKRLFQEGRLNAVQAAAISPARPAEELYDLAADPHETINLASRNEHQDVLRQLRAVLENWIVETDDKGQYPEDERQLRFMLSHWGDRCVNPEFQRLRRQVAAGAGPAHDCVDDPELVAPAAGSRG